VSEFPIRGIAKSLSKIADCQNRVQRLIGPIDDVKYDGISLAALIS
jgi:hypothetical protein